MPESDNIAFVRSKERAKATKTDSHFLERRARIKAHMQMFRLHYQLLNLRTHLAHAFLNCSLVILCLYNISCGRYV